MYACIYAPDFAVQAAVRLRPEMRDLAIAILEAILRWKLSLPSIEPHARKALRWG